MVAVIVNHRHFSVTGSMQSAINGDASEAIASTVAFVMKIWPW